MKKYNEIRWMLEQERRAIQPHQEEVEIINLGTEEDKKEIKIGVLLDATVKERIIALLKEYADIFAWTYKDMPGQKGIKVDPDKVKPFRICPLRKLKSKSEVFSKG